MYLIKTNCDGVLFGDYCAEGFDSFKKAKKKFQQVRKADPKAKICKVIEIKEGV